MYTGPKLTNDNLVFGYDTGYGIADNGTETRFYKGEPTSNILPSPEVNGRFTTGNGWRSYNTNQYNSNNDFSIGTVSGVSNNIVTLSSVGHTIRSFDVLNPATSGGGVTAGTNYVVKKISSSTFSLHAYNNSQDGSQGYINPATGTHKVLDSYANDTRISISASGFPTMWHGAPHLPNSALIKEIVPNGGRIEGTNCMRLHVFRGDNVRDGMAYNVYCPVTQGDVITVSYWVRPVNSFAHGKTWNYQTYFGSGNSSSSFNTTLNSTGEWQHVVHQWTASVTYNFYSYWFPSASTDVYAIDMADLQVEINKGHATPFTLTSRSNTESLIDLTKSTDLTLSAMTYDSTGQPDYDGTDDYINLGDYAPIRLGTNFTIECVVRPEEDKWMYFFWKGYGSNNSLAWGRHSSGDNWFFSTMIGGSYQNNYMGTATLNKYCHLVATYDGANLRLYENGDLKVTSAKTHDMLTSSYDAVIGAGNGRHWNGKIPVTKIYSKVLTTEEVVSNFNAYKNRFDIQ